MIHACVFKTTDPSERATLLLSGDWADIARNTPAGGCWRLVPVGCATAQDVPPLGDLPIASV